MSDKISVLIPVYNTEDYINKCLDSILSQTHQNIEIIVVNDGSTDRTSQILDYYAVSDSRIKVIHQSNGGHQSARKAAIDVATGDYITFVDSDDSLASKQVLEVMLSKFTSDTIVVTGYTDLDDGEKLKRVPLDYFTTIPTNEYLEKLLTGRGSWNLWGKLYRAFLIKNIDMSPIKVTTAEDALVNIMLMANTKGNVKMVDISVYNYFVRNGSITQSRNKQNIFDNFKVASYISDALKDKVESKYIVAFELLCFSNSFRYGWLGRCHNVYSSIMSRYKVTTGVMPLLVWQKRIKIWILIHYGNFISKYIYKNSI